MPTPAKNCTRSQAPYRGMHEIAKMAQHDQHQMQAMTYMETSIRSEAMQACERARHSRQIPHTSHDHKADLLAIRKAVGEGPDCNIASITKQYGRPTAFSETPMERFCTESPINDPWSAYSGKGLNLGSLSGLEIRSVAAHTTASLNVGNDCDIDVNTQTLFKDILQKHRNGQGERSDIDIGKVRTAREVKLRRQITAGGDRGGPSKRRRTAE